MPEKPSIFIFSTSYLPFASGAEIAVKEITDRLPGFDWHMITAQFDGTLPKEEKLGYVTVHRIGMGWPTDKFILPLIGTIKTFFLMRKYKPVAFWGLMATYASGIPYIINILRSSKKKIPMILTLQEGDSEEHIDHKRFGVVGFLWRIAMIPAIILSLFDLKRTQSPSDVHTMGMIQLSWRLAFARTDFLTVISNYLAERARHYGYAGPCVLIPNGVDIAKFTDASLPEKRSHIAARLGKNPGDIYLVTTSRLVEKNALDDVIKALSFLPPYVSFIILGSGDLQEAWQKIAEEAQVQERVQFIGFVPYEEIPAYLHASDIFVRPSLSEGMGNSFLEAMAVGLPVIATRVGGIPDFLFDPETPEGREFPTGLYCGLRDPKSIADKVLQLLQDEELRKKIVYNGFQLVTQKYQWDFIAKDMKEKVLDVVIK